MCSMLPRWDEQNALLVESHERVIKDLTEEAEAKLAVEVLAAQTLKQERESLLKEASEVTASHMRACCSFVDAGSHSIRHRGPHMLHAVKFIMTEAIHRQPQPFRTDCAVLCCADCAVCLP